ncbi:MAG: hypothetical protein ACOCXM_03370 [Myxococcota bacterium]
MEEKHARGFVVMGIAKYIDEAMPEGGQQVRAATPEVTAHRHELTRTQWYPLSYAVDQCAAIAAKHQDPQEAWNEVERCGEFIANDAASSFLKLLMKVLTPSLFARQFPEVWKRYHDFGSLQTDLSQIENNTVVFTVPGYDYVGPLVAGWIRYIFRSFGKSNLEIETNVPAPGVPAPEEVRFVVSWS